MKVTSIQLGRREISKAEATAHALALVDQASSSDLILLPEMWPSGFFRFDRYPVDAEPIDGPVVQAFREKAAAIGCHILMGSFVERRTEGLFNTSLLIDFVRERDRRLPQNSLVRLPIQRARPAHPRHRSGRDRHAMGESRIGHLLRSAVPGTVSQNGRPRGGIFPGGLGLAGGSPGTLDPFQSCTRLGEPGVSNFVQLRRYRMPDQPTRVTAWSSTRWETSWPRGKIKNV